ncbi:ADP-ribosyltransferase family protein [Lignipirellula cremea]|uniref:hypothetical protein n=1 Tax=Lignipirellula cremea TaxID=2528010 RepID=UPI0011A243C1|nr:hypothetical protein [Lignipirellula cremea]
MGGTFCPRSSKSGWLLSGPQGDAFLSFTRTPFYSAAIPDDGGVVFRLKAKTGVYISGVGNSNEHEVLQNTGQTYKIERIEKRVFEGDENIPNRRERFEVFMVESMELDLD